MDADVIIVGGGLAGLVAACDTAARGKQTIVVDQEGEQNARGQALRPLCGSFMADPTEQHRMRPGDSRDLGIAGPKASPQ